MRISFVGICAAICVFVSHAEGATASKSAPKAKPKPPARLIVQRAPNFGTNLVLQLWVDGKKTANIPRNQHYGGLIPAGRHTVTALVLPNTLARRPTSMRVRFESSKVYLYTAMWDKDRLILRPSTNYIPTQAVKPIH